MISGVAIAAKTLNPNIKIFAAEPRGNNSTWQSKRVGDLVNGPNPQTMADGLRASMGSLTWLVSISCFGCEKIVIRTKNIFFCLLFFRGGGEKNEKDFDSGVELGREWECGV